MSNFYKPKGLTQEFNNYDKCIIIKCGFRKVTDYKYASPRYNLYSYYTIEKCKEINTGLGGIYADKVFYILSLIYLPSGKIRKKYDIFLCPEIEEYGMLDFELYIDKITEVSVKETMKKLYDSLINTIKDMFYEVVSW